MEITKIVPKHQIKSPNLRDYPAVMEEWNEEKNGILIPERVHAGTAQKVWWMCKNGHEWEAEVRTRTYRNYGCPYCSGRYAIRGKTDLASQNPGLAKEWDMEKNGGLTPDMVTIKSGKKVWWKCFKGHSWAASVNDRSSGKGCPYCSGRRTLHGYNDLATLRPDIAAEWDHAKNENLDPEKVTLYSHKAVWWKCRRGHSWHASVATRTLGMGCPYCSGARTIQGENDLETLCPEVASKWDYEANGTLQPQSLSKYSMRIVWWRCPAGHKWQRAVRAQVQHDICPVCKAEKKQRTSIAVLYPDLLADWDWEKNDVKPENVQAGSAKKVWWRCFKGHSWEMEPRKRARGEGCPTCKGIRVLTGYNDLATLRPDLASEWDWEKNGLRKPQMYTPYSGEKVYWQCKMGHSWRASIGGRSAGHGCRICNRVLLPENNPVVKMLWAGDINGPLTNQLQIGTQYWFRCPRCGTVWAASLKQVMKGDCMCPRFSDHGWHY